MTLPVWLVRILWVLSTMVNGAIVADLSDTSRGDKWLAAAGMVLTTLIAQGRPMINGGKKVETPKLEGP